MVAAGRADLSSASHLAVQCISVRPGECRQCISFDRRRSAAVLDDTEYCWTGCCVIGLTLDELADLAQMKTDRTVSVIRDLTADEFQEHMKRSNDPDRRYIINFNREGIFGAGSGHHSPIGGYLEEEDMVFVLDVNERFKPWLVERERLFKAMDTLDGDRKRGLLLIE